MYSNLIFSLFLITSLKPPCKCCRILLLEYFYFSTFSILYLFKESYWIPFLVCRQDQIEKYSAQCATYLKYGFCTAANMRHFMEQNCPVTCRVCQGKLLTNSKFYWNRHPLATILSPKKQILTKRFFTQDLFSLKSRCSKVEIGHLLVNFSRTTRKRRRCSCWRFVAIF